jgi:tubulin--tyrosine ligase
VDLTPHLTNTSLQTHRGEEGVFLFDELVECSILSERNAEGQRSFEEEDAANILDQMCDVLADTFKAAVENPVHFQVS